MPAEDPESSRKLILATGEPDVRVILVRASDVPTYVQYGAADLGVAGRDLLDRARRAGPLPAARPRHRALPDDGGRARGLRLRRRRCSKGARLRVATKYIGIAREHFAAKGVHVDLIKLYGSMELAPLVGLADAIVDLVDTGNTLRANHLQGGRGDHGGVEPAHRESRLDEAEARGESLPLIEAFERACRG